MTCPRCGALVLYLALAAATTAADGANGGWRGADGTTARSVAGMGPSAASPARLADSLPRFLDEPAFSHASWGVEIRAADTGALIYQTNAQKLLKPASNAKLFTAALALDRLGPAFTIETELLAAGPIRTSGALRGDLVVYGRGDPSFAARFLDGNAERSLDRLVKALLRAGIRRVDGALVGDDSYFSGPPFGAGWTWDDLQHYYGAEVNALSVDENVVDLVFRPGNAPGEPIQFEAKPATPYLEFRTGCLVTGTPGGAREVEIQRASGSRVVEVSGTLPAGGEPWTDAVTVPDPARYFLTRLQERLTHHGLRVRGGIRVERGARARLMSGGRNLPPPIVVRSPPLAELLPWMLKPSQNLAAQLLLLQVGAHETPGAAVASTEVAGLDALGHFLEGAGIPAASVQLDEGSGLSRSCLVTPAALVQLLAHMDRHRHREPFLAALPVAGVDGTLRRRLLNTTAAGNLRAKTGSLRHVDTLSGFVTNAARRRLVFSVMLNAYRPPDGGLTGREVVDAVAERVAASTDDPSR